MRSQGSKKAERLQQAPDYPTRLLRSIEVQRRTSLSRSSLYRLAREGKLPRPLQLSAHRVAWREQEIEAWIAARPAGLP